MPTLFDLWVDHIFHQTPPSPQLDYTSTEWFMFTILKQAFQNGIIKQKIHVKTYWISIPVLLIAVKWDAIGNCSSPELQVAICRIFLLSIANCSSFICFPIFSEEWGVRRQGDQPFHLSPLPPVILCQWPVAASFFFFCCQLPPTLPPSPALEPPGSLQM